MHPVSVSHRRNFSQHAGIFMIFRHIFATLEFLFRPLERTVWQSSQVLNEQNLPFAANVTVANAMKIILKFIFEKTVMLVFYFIFK